VEYEQAIYELMKNSMLAVLAEANKQVEELVDIMRVKAKKYVAELEHLTN